MIYVLARLPILKKDSEIILNRGMVDILEFFNGSNEYKLK